ncbi:protein ABHD11-like isoform X2 [Phlebotomus papatasi]|uniref:protein ABHD11-like isoform X2 n=1 Tax=Phlebotomus papatasi TaxID=29031 RepID=UPI002483756F|nr:protein ABHD11-like isoform X2 [Phlebotomus papatasi]
MARLMRFLPGFSNSVVNSRHLSHNIQPVKLSYDEYLPKDPQSASGAPLLIMHGLFGSRQNWRGISKRLTQVLNPSRRILSIDGRNHGLSPHASEHTYQHMAEDVKELIRDIGAEKVVVLGHSMGGRCMMYFALEYPELVESAVIVDISPFSNIHFAGSTEAMSDLLRTLQGITIDPSLSPSAARKLVDEEISSIMTDKATRDFILLNLYKDENSGFRWRFNVQGLLDNVETSIAKFPAEILERKYSKPILFIGGADSQYINPKDLPRIQESFPQARLEFVANAGHLVHVQKPMEFLDLVVNFLNR